MHINRRGVFEQLRGSEGPGRVAGRQKEGDSFDLSQDILMLCDRQAGGWQSFVNGIKPDDRISVYVLKWPGVNLSRTPFLSKLLVHTDCNNPELTVGEALLSLWSFPLENRQVLTAGPGLNPLSLPSCLCSINTLFLFTEILIVIMLFRTVTFLLPDLWWCWLQLSFGNCKSDPAGHGPRNPEAAPPLLHKELLTC